MGFIIKSIFALIFDRFYLLLYVLQPESSYIILIECEKSMKSYHILYLFSQQCLAGYLMVLAKSVHVGVV